MLSQGLCRRSPIGFIGATSLSATSDGQPVSCELSIDPTAVQPISIGRPAGYGRSMIEKCSHDLSCPPITRRHSQCCEPVLRSGVHRCAALQYQLRLPSVGRH